MMFAVHRLDGFNQRALLALYTRIPPRELTDFKSPQKLHPPFLELV